MEHLLAQWIPKGFVNQGQIVPALLKSMGLLKE